MHLTAKGNSSLEVCTVFEARCTPSPLQELMQCLHQWCDEGEQLQPAASMATV